MLRRLADRYRRFEVTWCAQLQVSYEYKGLTIEKLSIWNKKRKSDTGNNKANWNHLKITQTVSEQHIRKAQN
jgi:hypothetical protein